MKTTIVQDECWNCGRPFTFGDTVVEVTLSKVVERNNEVAHDLMKHGIYERHCLRCGCEALAGVNEDNLDACFPAWRHDPSFVPGEEDLSKCRHCHPGIDYDIDQ